MRLCSPFGHRPDHSRLSWHSLTFGSPPWCWRHLRLDLVLNWPKLLTVLLKKLGPVEEDTELQSTERELEFHRQRARPAPPPCATASGRGTLREWEYRLSSSCSNLQPSGALARLWAILLFTVTGVHQSLLEVMVPWMEKIVPGDQ